MEKYIHIAKEHLDKISVTISGFYPGLWFQRFVFITHSI